MIYWTQGQRGERESQNLDLQARWELLFYSYCQQNVALGVKFSNWILLSWPKASNSLAIETVIHLAL